MLGKLLREWNGNIRLPELKGCTINEAIAIEKERDAARLRFELPQDPTTALLNRYMRAMANLYDVIPIAKAYEIINEQNPGMITREAFDMYCKQLKDPSELVFVRRNEILSQVAAY